MLAKFERILCTRMYMNTIGDSVHTLIKDRIASLGLSQYFDITNTEIRCKHNGSYIIYKGLAKTINEIKSTEGITICWIEEAQDLAKQCFEILKPTIRVPGSQIILTFNPQGADDFVWRDIVEGGVLPEEDTVQVHINYLDNPWCSPENIRDAEHCRKTDPEAYNHIWLGNPWTRSDAQVFAGIYDVEEFESPDDVAYYYGADFGFSQDDTSIVRCFIMGDVLYIDYAISGKKIEIIDTPSFFMQVPGARDSVIRADRARPEVISHCQTHGLPNIVACEKWENCVEDGVSTIRSFRRVKIHPRCKPLITEFLKYEYVKDRTTGDVTRKIRDKYNHAVDSLRYSLEKVIQTRGQITVTPHIAEEVVGVLESFDGGSSDVEDWIEEFGGFTF